MSRGRIAWVEGERRLIRAGAKAAMLPNLFGVPGAIGYNCPIAFQISFGPGMPACCVALSHPFDLLSSLMMLFIKLSCVSR